MYPQSLDQSDQAGDAAEKVKVLYILQITRSKLNHDMMKMLKCLLCYILSTTKSEHLVLEVHYDVDEFDPLPSYIGLILKLLVNGYNLLEPEHSKDFPLT